MRLRLITNQYGQIDLSDWCEISFTQLTKLLLERGLTPNSRVFERIIYRYGFNYQFSSFAELHAAYRYELFDMVNEDLDKIYCDASSEAVKNIKRNLKELLPL